MTDRSGSAPRTDAATTINPRRPKNFFSTRRKWLSAPGMVKQLRSATSKTARRRGLWLGVRYATRRPFSPEGSAALGTPVWRLATFHGTGVFYGLLKRRS